VDAAGFDRIARAVGEGGVSRRRVVRALLGGAAAGVVAAVGGRRVAAQEAIGPPPPCGPCQRVYPLFDLQIGGGGRELRQLICVPLGCGPKRACNPATDRCEPVEGDG
jgi:hypothetical protein